MTHLVVIGGGIAGTAAALAARVAGAQVTLLDGGPGASALAGGALDLAPWEDAEEEADDAALAEPAARGVLDALAELFEILAAPTTVATVAGILRSARASDRALLDLGALGAGLVLVPRAEHPGWDAGALARAWNDTRLARGRGLEFVAVDATTTRLADERHLAHAEMAARHDEPARLAWLAERLAEAVARYAGGRVVGLVTPPWLGVDAPRARALSDAARLPCGEAMLGPGGPAGLRFERARDRALARAGVQVTRARATEVGRAETGDGCVVRLESGALDADRVVLATGGLVGGGLAYAPSASVLAGEMPARARASIASTVEAPVTIGAHGRALGVPGSLFGESPESLAWPTAAGTPLIERAGVLASRTGHAGGALFAAGDVVADRPRTWLGALAQGARAGAAAAARTE